MCAHHYSYSWPKFWSPRDLFVLKVRRHSDIKRSALCWVVVLSHSFLIRMISGAWAGIPKAGIMDKSLLTKKEAISEPLWAVGRWHLFQFGGYYFHRETRRNVYLYSRYVGVDIFLSGSSSWKIVLVFSLISEGFIYSEKNIMGLRCVLKKRYFGLICGVWNYWVGPSEQGVWQVIERLY